jgi:hypothetical protein
MGKRAPEPEVEAAAAGSRLKLLEDGAAARRPAGARRALRRSESSRRREDMDMFLFLFLAWTKSQSGG